MYIPNDYKSHCIVVLDGDKTKESPIVYIIILKKDSQEPLYKPECIASFSNEISLCENLTKYKYINYTKKCTIL